MTSRHLVSRAADAEFTDVTVGGSKGLSRWTIVDEASAAVHTGFRIAQLAPGGRTAALVHSYEESFFVLSGAPVVQTPEGAWRVGPGDYGVLSVGTPHAWRNDSESGARWVEMMAPQPRARFHGDTFFPPALLETVPVPIDVRDPRTRFLGHFDPGHMDIGRQSQDQLAVSASMRTALLVYSGITVKMMVDTDLGAQLSTMFMVQYDPDGVAGRHDHPFEETYLFLEGTAEAVFDDEAYQLEAGDVAWAGVGCVHGFRNTGSGPVRWLETQAPQPPARHSYRFARDWDYLGAALASDKPAGSEG